MTPLFAWLLDTTVKGSVLILLVAAIQWLIGSRVDARLRHLLWVIVLLRLLMPAAPASSWSMFNVLPDRTPATAMHVISVESTVPAAGGAAGGQVLRVQPAPERPGLRWILGIWLIGVAFFVVRMTVAATRMLRALPRERRRDEGDGLPVVETHLVRTPALHGLFRPVLLLPADFRSRFTAEELRHVMLHELWHVRRMDVAVSWLLAVVQAVHWFNPLVWFAASRIREERELACDELALSLLEEEERPGYGRTILKLLDRFRSAAPVPALVGIVNQKQKMKRRLTMIASFRNGTRSTVLFLALVSALSVAALTDAEATRVRFTKTLDPAAAASAERLHQKLSFELTSVSLGELLNVVSNKTGVAVVQDPEIVGLDIQKARFTIKAEEVPAHIVLMEALIPFQLAAVPTAEGVTIKSGGARSMRFTLKNGEHLEETVADGDVMIKMRQLKAGDAAPGSRRVIVRSHAATATDVEDHRQIRVRLDEADAASHGKLTIKIAN